MGCWVGFQGYLDVKLTAYFQKCCSFLSLKNLNFAHQMLHLTLVPPLIPSMYMLGGVEESLGGVGGFQGQTEVY